MRGTVQKKREKQKHKIPHAVLCGKKTKTTAVTKNCSLLVRHTQCFRGGGALTGGPSPPSSAATHMPSSNGQIPLTEQLHLSNKDNQNPAGISGLMDMILKCIQEGKQQTLVTRAGGPTLPDVLDIWSPGVCDIGGAQQN